MTGTDRSTMRRGRARRVGTVLAVLASLTFATGVVASGGGAGASVPTYTWPEFHGSPALTGVSADPAISTANASTLGVSWMSPIGAAEDSSAVAYDSTLGS